MPRRLLYGWLGLLLVASFTLAVRLEVWYADWAGNRATSADLLKVVLGDSRRLFANHFFIKADVYFHSGYYPSIFEQGLARSHLTEAAGGVPEADEEHEAEFLHRPRDWIDRFGRNFYPTRHTHLEHGEEREMLPWLRLSAELDPRRVETYIVAAYWMRTRLGQVNEAEQFLREGLRANPDSFEILFELGRVSAENRHDPAHARILWELALRKWRRQETAGKAPDRLLLQQIVSQLAILEEQAGHKAKAIGYLEILKTVSPSPASIERQIDDLKKKPAVGAQ